MFWNIINSELLFIFVLIAGFTAIYLEVFIPSFGLVGVIGAYLLVNALIAMPNIDNAYLLILISFVASIILGTLIINIFFTRGSNNKLVLKTSLNNAEDKKFASYSSLLGKEAYVEKTLRPTGTIRIDDTDYEAMSYGEFISVGEVVLIDKIEGNRIYCRRKK